MRENQFVKLCRTHGFIDTSEPSPSELIFPRAFLPRVGAYNEVKE